MVGVRGRMWLAAATAAVALAGAPRAEAQDWAPVSQATIRPGVQVFTEGSQCTANFVFSDGRDVYLGYAAHCTFAPTEDGGPVRTGGGCAAPLQPVGTPVEVAGASHPGHLAYSSFAVMQALGEEDTLTCAFNDFALVRLDPADVARVNPTVPHWGGPTGFRTGPVAVGEKALSYGNSGLRQGIEALKPREGYVVEGDPEGWTYSIYFVTPGIFGDSGSGVMDAAGSALGVLNTIRGFPTGSNGASILHKVVAYMRANSDLDAVRLALGTEPFTGPQLGPGLVPSPEPQPEPAPEPEPQPQPAPPPPPPPPPASQSDSSPAASKPAVRRRAAKRCRRAKARARRGQAKRKAARRCAKQRKRQARRS